MLTFIIRINMSVKHNEFCLELFKKVLHWGQNVKFHFDKNQFRSLCKNSKLLKTKPNQPFLARNHPSIDSLMPWHFQGSPLAELQ